MSFQSAQIFQVCRTDTTSCRRLQSAAWQCTSVFGGNTGKAEGRWKVRALGSACWRVRTHIPWDIFGAISIRRNLEPQKCTATSHDLFIAFSYCFSVLVFYWTGNSKLLSKSKWSAKFEMGEENKTERVDKIFTRKANKNQTNLKRGSREDLSELWVWVEPSHCTEKKSILFLF